MAATFSIFLTGGTGYIGTPLIRALLRRGHQVRALVRPGSERKLPLACEMVFGNALDPASYADRVAPSHTFVQLVGVHHPSPAKAAEFQKVDRVSALGVIEAAKRARVEPFIYLSVAQPAPVMKGYIAVRAECEAALRSSAMNITIVRPWYVLGPPFSRTVCQVAARTEIPRLHELVSHCPSPGIGDTRVDSRHRHPRIARVRAGIPDRQATDSCGHGL